MTTTIKALIVDDEASAIETLQGMLDKFCPQVSVVASVTSVEDALLALRQHDPSLVFLDIELPPFGKGFDLLRAVPERSFQVVFTTAYAEYAVQAINEAQPLGYLVKPYRVSDLVQVVLTAAKVAEAHATKRSDTPAIHQGIIIPDSRKGQIVIHVQHILYATADGSVTDIFVLRPSGQVEKITASRSLKDLENELPALLFCRTHHSFVVNLQHVLRYQRTGRNGIIFLPHGHKADISVAKMERFEQAFAHFLKGDAL